jgi:hypothetical protein
MSLVSPTLHPEVIRHAAGPEHADDPVVQALSSRVERSRARAEQFFQVQKVVREDPTIDLDRKYDLEEDAILKTLRLAMSEQDGSRAEAAGALAAIEAELRTTYHMPTEGQGVAGEIRRAFAAMPEAERNKILDAAIEKRDRVTIASVLCLPGYLSGLPDPTVTYLRERWVRVVNPKAVARREAIKRALEAYDQAGSALVNIYAEHASKQPPATREAREARKKAMRVVSNVPSK